MRPLVVVCAGSAWDGVAGTDRMFATELARYARVLWVDPPASPVTAGGRRWRPRLSDVDAGIVGLRPVALPLHSRAGIRRTTPVLVRAQIDGALRRLRARPHAVVDCGLRGLLRGWAGGVHTVFYGTDDFVAGAALMGLDAAGVAARERSMVDSASLVLAVSPALVERWEGMGAARTVLVPNGVTAMPEAPPSPDVALPPPVAGLAGHLSARIDIAHLEAVVAHGCSLLLVGPHDPRWEPRRFAALCARPGVTWTGFRPHEALPAYLAHVSVGLTPYADTAFNRASFPLKTLEYLAAGRAVVSTDLPATRWLGTDLVRVCADPESFGRAAYELGTDPRPDLAPARRAFAARHSWAARVETVAAAIGLT